MVVGDVRHRTERGDAAGPRRRDVSAESGGRDSGAGRRDGRLALGVSPEGGAGTESAAAGSGGGVQRNIAIYGDKIFATTNDAHIVAVDARTGKLVWDTKVADAQLGYEYTSGPIVVRGKVIAGMTGCTHYKEDVCFITGHDCRHRKGAVAHIDHRTSW